MFFGKYAILYTRSAMKTFRLQLNSNNNNNNVATATSFIVLFD